LIIILIDSREQNGPYIQKRFESAGIDSEIVCFPKTTSCDYLITNHKGSCAIQRKVVCSELLSELDEIMHEIVPNLAQFSDNPCLLVEENFDITKDGYLQDHNSGRHTEMKATAYYNYLETIRKHGVDVYTTRNLNASIYWMIAMHGYLEKQHYPKHRKFFTIEEQAIGMLTCVPGIGEARARKALAGMCIAGMNGGVPGLTVKQNEKLGKALRWCAE
jgi:ERCC4-type nuclease